MAGDEEGREERADRNLPTCSRAALLCRSGAVRVLLTVPFSQRFDRLSDFEEWLYFGVLITVGLATVLLVAPTAGHRILFRRQQKEFIVTLSNTLALIGLLLLALAMTGAIALISSFIFGTTTAVCSTIVMAAAFIGFWFLGPIRRRQKLPPRASSAD
jgi:hypothetical protein